MIKPIAIFLILTLWTSAGSPTEPGPDRAHPNTLRLKAHDTINLSIQELKGTTTFFKSIPQLKALLKANPNRAGLDVCVNQSVSTMDLMRSTLHRLRHLSPASPSSDAGWLRREMAHQVNLSKTCRKSFGCMDEVVLSLLTRKLDDLNLVINGVLRLVSGN